MNGLKRIFLFLAVTVLQLHAAIPHHHHNSDLADQLTLCAHNDAEDLSHPDLGANHLEDLADQIGKRWFMPYFAAAVVAHVVVCEVIAPIAQRETPHPPAQYCTRHHHRGPPLH